MVDHIDIFRTFLDFLNAAAGSYWRGAEADCNRVFQKASPAS